MRNTICFCILFRFARILVRVQFVFIKIMLSSQNKIFIDVHLLEEINTEVLI